MVSAHILSSHIRILLQVAPSPQPSWHAILGCNGIKDMIVQGQRRDDNNYHGSTQWPQTTSCHRTVQCLQTFGCCQVLALLTAVTV